jgi:glycerol-3-phosphate O-acyltransferase
MEEVKCMHESTGDKTVYFFDAAKKMMHNSKINEDLKITTENTYQLAYKANRDALLEVMRAGHLPGSTILGVENVLKLAKLAAEGKSCLIMSEHVSNLDVPSMFVRFYDYGNPDLIDIFEKIVFIAGAKLNENPLIKLYTEMFSRIVNIPPSSMSKLTEKEDIELATKINRTAIRKLVELRKKGYIFLLFPAATRYRPWKPETKIGIKETASYLSSFDYFCCCSINGNNMPPREHEDMTREPYLQDVITFNYGEVQDAKSFSEKYGSHDPASSLEEKENLKQVITDKVMEEIERLHIEAEEYRKKYI